MNNQICTKHFEPGSWDCYTLHLAVHNGNITALKKSITDNPPYWSSETT
jgi:hypothetical protein